MTDMAELVCGIDHVGIAVADLDRALATYSTLFGARVIHDESNEKQGVREVMVALGPPSPDGSPDGSTDRSTEVSADGSETRLQLLVPLREDSPVAAFLRGRGEGVQQIAYTVRDLVRASAVLRARGIGLIYDEPQQGTAGSRVNFIHPHDAHGVLVELVEPADMSAS